MTITPIRLAPDTDAWEKQPGETPKKYGQFITYRDMGRTRTIAETAKKLARSDSYLRQVAAEYRWTERAEAWDTHNDQLHQRQWLDKRREAAEHDAKILGAAVGKIAQRLQTLNANDLSNGDLIRLLDVVMRHRRALFGDPQATVAVTGPGGDPLTVQLAEFAELPADRRRALALHLAESVQRRAQAAAGVDDDDE